MSEAFCPQGLNHLFCFARALREMGAEAMRAATLDVKNARKAAPLNAGGLSYATASCMCPDAGAIYKSTCRVLPFGAQAFLQAWGRIICFLQFLLRNVVYVHAGTYVDDIHIIEADETANSGFGSTKAFPQVTGFEAESAKCQPQTIYRSKRTRNGYTTGAERSASSPQQAPSRRKPPPHFGANSPSCDYRRMAG